MADSKTELVAAKKGGLLSGLGNIGSFLGRTFVAYKTSLAEPATIAPAPPPPQPTSMMTPTLVIVGAAVVGFLLLRRR